MIENPARRIEQDEKAKHFGKWTEPFRWGGRVGAASELTVCADLLRKGWDVFRAVSAQCVFDLVAVKGPCLLRVEVRTAKKSKKTGKLNASKYGTYDVLAMVKDHEVVYRPELPTVGGS